jgi:hypothetical protein
MLYWVTDNFGRSYTLASPFVVDHDAEPLVFWDRVSARNFLSKLYRDWLAKQSLDQAYYALFGARGGSTDDAILARLTGELLSGTFRIYPGNLERPRPVVGLAPPEREEERAPVGELDKVRFFAVRVVDDETGRPVAGAKLTVELAGGSSRSLVSGADGVARLDRVEASSGKVFSLVGGAVLASSLAFVAVGESPSGRQKGGATGAKRPGTTKKRDAQAGGASWSLVKVVEHKVKSGETLQAIARESGLTPAQLAVFNWGVYTAPEIEAALRDQVGCHRKTEDGKYLFDDADEPGVVYVPGPWESKDLAADKVHTVRVRPILRALPDLHFAYQIDPHEEEAKNDLLILEAEDGSWSHEVAVADLTEIDKHWVELVFPEPPAGVRFNLIQDPKDGDEPFYVFMGATYGELREAHDEQVASEQEGADEV